MPAVVGLLTDFGMRDWYVASMKGVILSQCPRVQLVDITHEIPPQDVVAGAFVLAAAVPWFPRGAAIVGVVDPGVGSARALLAAEVDGRYVLGPDNGLLALTLEQATRKRVVRLTRSRYWLPEISRTFHGRDILAPVAAQLLRGVALARLGVAVRRVRPLALPPIRQRAGRRDGAVVHIDSFGNLVTNLPGGLLDGERTTVRYRKRPVRVVSSYGDGRPRELVALVGSLGFIELSVRDDSAAKRVGGSRGDPVVLEQKQHRSSQIKYRR